MVVGGSRHTWSVDGPKSRMKSKVNLFFFLKEIAVAACNMGKEIKADQCNHDLQMHTGTIDLYLENNNIKNR